MIPRPDSRPPAFDPVGGRRVNLSSLLRLVKESLESAGVPSPSVDAEILISHALKIPRSSIYLEPGMDLSPSDQSLVEDLARERGMRVPLQYVMGECEFMSLTFKVTKGVFIPRPETEVLVEALLERIEGRSGRPGTILDLGTGSGVIAVSLAAHFGAGLVIGSDISPLAVEIAGQNAILNGVDDRTRFVLGDGLDCFRAVRGGQGEGRFDVVACNPPYVGSGEIDMLEPEVRDHEPRVALDGGVSGLEFIEDILPRIPSILVRGGIVGLEIGETQAGRVTDILRGAGFKRIEVIEDLNGKARVVVGRGA
jgi:release factor glutamine methyltransferase